MYVDQKPAIFEIKTAVKRPPMISTGFLGAFALIGMLMPFVIFGVMTHSGDGLKLGHIISSLVFFGVGLYIFRLVSWNYNGVEVIEVFEDEVVYRAKTKLFTLQTHQLELVGCIMGQFNEKNGTANYFLRNGEQLVEMKFRAEVSDLHQLEKTINERNE